MVLSYEGLRADPEHGFIRLTAHLGVSCGPAEARAALAQASFPNMLASELRTGVRGYDYDRRDPEARRVRRGRIGGYRDYLDADDVRYVADVCAEQLSPAARAVLQRHGLAPWHHGA
jgi:alcohol sulfotransferase